MAKAEANKTEALAKAGSTAVARPSYLDDITDMVPMGFEAMSNKDVAVARLALAQSMTRARKKGNDKYIEGLQEGQFFNSLTKEIYGEELTVIPLFFHKNRIMFKDLDQGGGIICQAPDGVRCQLNAGGPCLHGNWGANGEKPECTEFFNYPALILDGMTPKELIVLSFKSTAQKKAKEWNSRMRMMKADMFAQIWKISSIPDKKDTFDFFNVQFDFVGYVPNEELYQSMKKSYEGIATALREGHLVIDQERPEEDDTNFNHGANTTGSEM